VAFCYTAARKLIWEQGAEKQVQVRVSDEQAGSLHNIKVAIKALKMGRS
jgi:hypothetical protein